MATTDQFDEMEFIDPFSEENLAQTLSEIDREREEAKSEQKPAQEAETASEEPKSKYSQQELLALYDTMVFEGRYTEPYRARGINAVFRTRTGDDVIKLNQYLDSYQAKSMASLQTYSNMLTLAASLKSINGKEFEDGDIKSVYIHLKTLPDAVNTLLLVALTDFDRKVGEAIEEGRKNF